MRIGCGTALQSVKEGRCQSATVPAGKRESDYERTETFSNALREVDEYGKEYASCVNSPNFLQPLPDEFSSQISEDIKNVPLCVIEDIGCGMTPEELENGFLSVGTSNKVNRTNTLGEKGIGRLSTQRLGKVIIVETASRKILSILRLDWQKIILGNDDVVIRDSDTKVDHYTRIWIFDINLTDFLDIDNQLSLEQDQEIKVNRDLETAITFLISPFRQIRDSHSHQPQISMYYESRRLDARLDMQMLECAESTHYFQITSATPNEELTINYGLKIQPWYVERLHPLFAEVIRASVSYLPTRIYQTYTEEVRKSLIVDATVYGCIL